MSTLQANKEIVSFFVADRDVILQIHGPDGHVSSGSPWDFAKAYTKLVDDKNWLQDRRDAFQNLLDYLMKWAEGHKQIHSCFVVTEKDSDHCLFLVMQTDRHYDIQFSLALSELHYDVATKPQFQCFSFDVQELPFMNVSPDGLRQMLQN